MLCMSVQDYVQIRRNYADEMDGDSAYEFVADMLDAEAKATAAKYPNALAAVIRLRDAEKTIRQLASELSGECFEED